MTNLGSEHGSDGGSPVPDARLLWALRGSVLAVPLLVYVLTLCPTVGPGDAAELATSGALLGVSHPPGYPLYTLLSRILVVAVPFGTPAARVNFLSAVFASISLLFLFEGLRRGLRALWTGWLACLVLAFSRAWWTLAVTAEVYTLNAFFLTFLLWLALRTREEPSSRNLLLLAYGFGLSLAHHLTIALAVPALVYIAAPAIRRGRKFLWPSAVAVLFPLTLYLYLPVRAALDPPYEFGNPEGWTGLWNHVTASGYRGNLLPGGLWTLAGTAGRFPAFFLEGIPYFLLWVPLVGGVACRRARRWVLAIVGLLAIPYAVFALLYAIPDIGAYFLPIHIAVAALGAAGLQALARWFGGAWARELGVRGRVRSAAGGLLLAMAVVAVLAYNFPWCNRSDYRLAETYGRGLLGTAELLSKEEAVLFVMGDHAVFPVAYLKLVESAAPRITVYDQAGAVLDDLYGDRKAGVRPRSRAERAAIEREIVLGAPGSVFYSQREKVPEGVGVAYRPVGLLFQPRADPLPPEVLERVWGTYGFPRMDDPHLYGDISARVIGGVYFHRRAGWELERGNRAGALEAMAKAEAVGHDVAGVQSRQVQLYLAVGDEAGALRSAERAARLAPGSPLVMNNLGNVYCMARRWEEAEVAFQRALARDPELAVVHANLAAVFYGQGQTPRSIRLLERALELDPALANARYNLALLLMKSGRRDDAVIQLSTVLETHPEHARARSLLEVSGDGAGAPPGAVMMLTFAF